MIPLNSKKILNRDLAVNKHDQQIRFCNTIVLKASDVARKFAIDKNWKSCFLIKEKFCACYLLQNFSQFILFKKIDKVRAKNLKRFSRGKSANLS